MDINQGGGGGGGGGGETTVHSCEEFGGSCVSIHGQ